MEVLLIIHLCVIRILKKGNKDNAVTPDSFNINCKDPLGRTAIAIAIENENLDMISVLLDEKIEPGVSSRDARPFPSCNICQRWFLIWGGDHDYR